MSEGKTVFVVDADTMKVIEELNAKVDRLTKMVGKLLDEKGTHWGFGFMRIDQILEVIPVGKSTWRLWVQEGKAPQGVFIGPRTKAWRVEDIRAFVAKLGAG